MTDTPNPLTAGLVSVGRGDTSYRCLALLYDTPEAANAAHAAILAAQTPDRLEQPVGASGQSGSGAEEGAGAGDSPLTRVANGLGDCGEGKPYADDSPAEAAALSAYSVLRCCGLITAGDWRVPERIGRTTQAMIEGRAAGDSPLTRAEFDAQMDDLQSLVTKNPKLRTFLAGMVSQAAEHAARLDRLEGDKP